MSPNDALIARPRKLESPVVVPDRPKEVPARVATKRPARVVRGHLVRGIRRVVTLLAGDVAVLSVLLFVLSGLRDQGWLGPSIAWFLGAILPERTLSLVQVVPAVVLGLAATGSYGAGDFRRDANRLVASAALGLGLPFWGQIWSHLTPYMLPGYVVAFMLVGVVLMAERSLIDRIVRRVIPVNPNAARALVVGEREEVVAGLSHPAFRDARECVIAGVYNPAGDAPGTRDQAFRRLCHEIEQFEADTLVLCGPLNNQGFSVLVDAALALGCQVYGLTNAYALAGVEPQIVWRRGAPLIAFTRPGLRATQLIVKRTLDMVGAVMGLVVLSPLMAVLGITIRLASPGPAFFAQRRPGLGGRTFRCLKFRSMRVDAEAQLQRSPALYEAVRRNGKLPPGADPRITRVGRWLRKTSLDELPQLWNVLRGDMSLVGPRPITPTEIDHYGERAPLLLSLKPGMTGAWAVRGRSTVGYPDRADIELDYIRHWSLWLDISIMIRTVPIILTARGAH